MSQTVNYQSITQCLLMKINAINIHNNDLSSIFTLGKMFVKEPLKLSVLAKFTLFSVSYLPISVSRLVGWLCA